MDRQLYMRILRSDLWLRDSVIFTIFVDVAKIPIRLVVTERSLIEFLYTKIAGYVLNKIGFAPGWCATVFAVLIGVFLRTTIIAIAVIQSAIIHLSQIQYR